MRLLSLFKEKISLHSRKYRLINKIDKIGLNQLYLKELKTILKKENKINRQLKIEIKEISKFFNIKIINDQLKHINQTTKKQLDCLNLIRFKLFKQANYSQFKEACRTEVEQSKFFSKILKETITNLKDFQLPPPELEKGKLLVRQAQKTQKELVKAIGNVKKVQQKAKELILINRKIKQTQLYEFIKYDIDIVTKKAKYALKNPKESKLRFILASAYIVSPGTFELTGIYLFFRYVKKYVKSKKQPMKN